MLLGAIFTPEHGWRAPKGFTMPKTMKMNKNGAKTKYEQYQKALESKSEELRRSM